MGLSRQEYWSGLPYLPPGDLPNPGIEPRSPALQADSLLSEPPGETKNTEMGCHTFLQGIFPTQGSNPGLPHCGQILYYLSHQGNVAIPSEFSVASWTWYCFTECIHPMLCTNKVFHIGLKAGFKKCNGLGNKKKKMSALKMLASTSAKKRDFVLSTSTHSLAWEITAFGTSACQEVPVTKHKIPKEPEPRFPPCLHHQSLLTSHPGLETRIPAPSEVEAPAVTLQISLLPSRGMTRGAFLVRIIDAEPYVDQ